MFYRIFCKHEALVAPCSEELWDAAVECPMDVFNWIFIQMDHQAEEDEEGKVDKEEKEEGDGAETQEEGNKNSRETNFY